MNVEWPPEEIAKLAASAGKPLEVAAAESFAQDNWKARLGSYFADGALDVPRELDVLAEKESDFGQGMPARVRALVSCKAFPADRSPISYSVPNSSALSFPPALPTSHRSQRVWRGDVQPTGPLGDLEEKAAARLLRYLGLDGDGPIVAYDQFQQTETTRKGRTEPDIGYKRFPDGDRQLFMGVDSCVKAAVFWTQEDYQQSAPTYFATVNVPVLLLSLPTWDIPIREGRTSAPQIKHMGYQTSLLPLRPRAKGMTTVVCEVGKLPVIIKALDDLLEWFAEACAGLAG